MALYPGGIGNGGGSLKYIICQNDVADISGPWDVQIPDAPASGYGYLVFGSALACGIMYQLDFSNGNFTKMTQSTKAQNQDLVEQRTLRTYDPATKTLSCRKTTSYGLSSGNVILFY